MFTDISPCVWWFEHLISCILGNALSHYMLSHYYLMWIISCFLNVLTFLFWLVYTCLNVVKKWWMTVHHCHIPQADCKNAEYSRSYFGMRVSDARTTGKTTDIRCMVCSWHNCQNLLKKLCQLNTKVHHKCFGKHIVVLRSLLLIFQPFLCHPSSSNILLKQ